MNIIGKLYNNGILVEIESSLFTLNMSTGYLNKNELDTIENYFQPGRLFEMSKEETVKAQALLNKYDRTMVFNAKGDKYNPYRDSEGKFADGLTIIEVERMLKKGGNKDKIEAAKKRLIQLEKKYPGRKYGEKFEAYADRYIRENPEKAISDYMAQVMKEFKSPVPNIVAADEAKKIIPGFEAARSADYHEPASSFVKSYYKSLLANETTMHLPVIFTAGGTGAGKSTALNNTMEAYDQYAAVYDGNLAGYDSAKSKIDAALATGRKVELTFVDRDPVTAFKYGVIPRTATEGRTITIKDHIQTHLDSRDVIVRMADTYKDNPMVTVTVVDNNGGLGEAHEVPLANISKNVYNKDSLKKELENEAKIARDNGQISEEVYGLITNQTADTTSESEDDSELKSASGNASGTQTSKEKVKALDISTMQTIGATLGAQDAWKNGDPLLTGVYDARGYHGKPKVVSKNQFDKLDKEQYVVTFRGIREYSPGVNETNYETYKEQFRTGEMHYASNGIYGAGTYTSTDPTYAVKYANDGTTLRIAVPKSANVISYETAVVESKAEVEKQTKLANDMFQKAFASEDKEKGAQLLKESADFNGIAARLNDPGLYAAYMGYDGMYFDGGEGATAERPYYIIYNRSMLVVDKEDYEVEL